MRRIIFPTMLLLLAWSCSQKNSEFPKSIVVEVVNNSPESRNDAMVVLSESDIKAKAADFNPQAFVVMDGDIELPSQYNAGDSESKGIVLIIKEIKGSEAKKLQVLYNPEGTNRHLYPKLTQAELSHKTGGEWNDREYLGGDFKNVDYMRVPAEHKDHSWFIRYEGPGWESDKVGYRFYLDQRNATDVFGKTVPEPSLQKAGLDGFDSYHELQDWGMDVMKVGPSLGVGSIGALPDTAAIRVEFTDSVTCAITENGPVYSSILTSYYGWKAGTDTVDLRSQLSIHSGTRVTREVLTLNKDLDYLCTGLVKDAKGELISSEPSADSYGYIATYGPQSLNNDNLGIAVLFSQESLVGMTDDQYSHIVKLKSSGGKLTYFFLAAWQGEPGGIKTKDEFVAYVNKVAKQLGTPLSVSYL